MSSRPRPISASAEPNPRRRSAGAAARLATLGLAAAACASGGAATRPLPVVRLAEGVYAVPGDSGRGEGRANAGFVVTGGDVLVVDALGSPAEGERLVASVRSVTDRPIRRLLLTHHHPDHHFGAIAVRRAGGRVLAHPDRSTAAAEVGEAELAAEWTRVVGAEAMRGFSFANLPEAPVERDTTLKGEPRVEVLAFPGAHTPSDLVVWLPGPGVLFAGDLLVEDGVTMLTDGDSGVALAALERLEDLRPRVVVPGHGAIEEEPARLIEATRRYLVDTREAMRRAVRDGRPLRSVVAELPPDDADRPVSRAARVRRNAVRVYLEMERELLEGGAGVRRPEDDAAANRLAAHAPPAPPRTIATAELADLLRAGEAVALLDVRSDLGAYLRAHLPAAAYLNVETLRATDHGVPSLLLPLESYRTVFSRLGVSADRPVVVYGAGEARSFEATYVAWILAGLGHPAVRVLDGGFGKWELEGRPTTQRYPAGAAPGFTAEEFRPERATLEDVRESLGRPGVVLVDARAPEQYAGHAGPQMRRGHIPGAVSHFWQDDLVEGEFARVWKDRSALRAAYAAEGITPDRDVIVYCNGGLESSHVHFTLRWILGYPRVRVYDGSFTEWAAREDLPVETAAR